MNLNEVKLFGPVKKHFEGLGYKIYCEIPCLYRVIDIIAIKEQEIIAIELKTGFCDKGLRQARSNTLAADKSYLAIKSKPCTSTIEKCKKAKIGIILVRDYIEILLEPQPTPRPPMRHYHDQLFELCDRNSENDVAGLPQLKGIGPAIEVRKAVEQYQEEHPAVAWKEIFANVPNHYASPASMKQSLERHRYFENLKKENEGRTCGECQRQGYSCPKGRNRRDTSKACINFCEKEEHYHQKFED